MFAHLVAGVLYGAVTQDSRAYTEEFTDAMRQMHWVLHNICTAYTRCDGCTDEEWVSRGYMMHRCTPVTEGH